MKNTINGFLRVNNLAETVFGHTLLQEIVAGLAGLGRLERSIHAMPDDNERGTPK